MRFMHSDKMTIQTYNQSAERLSEYFAGVGSRVEDVERAIRLTGQDPATIRAIELGCRDGRDAVEIASRVGWYEGSDPSTGLLEIARKRLPETSFKIADAVSYDYPKDIDLCFAFASLLHVSRDDHVAVFNKASVSLRPRGIFYISLKERQNYEEEIQEDQFGQRKFYYYNPDLVMQIAGAAFKEVFEDHQQIGATNWFTIALEKQPS